MSVLKVSVEVNGRELEAFVIEGVLASIETGSLDGDTEVPEHKVNIMPGENSGSPTAWVQVLSLGGGAEKVLNQGWVSANATSLEAVGTGSTAKATIESVANPTSEVMECQAEAKFGIMACCTARGSGCYVRCCNSCCSDPHRCPGASCCA